MGDIFVGLDIGTCNVRVVIGELNENNEFEIIGLGTSKTSGLRAGIIVNIEATMKSIKEAISKAEIMADCNVLSCFVGIGGSQIDSLNTKGMAAVLSREKENRVVCQSDIDRAIESALSISVPLDRKILHVIPQMYIVDSIQRTKNPIDMLGVRLEVEVHIVTAMITTMQNIFKSVTQSNYQVDGIMLKTLAAAQAVLTEEEKELGSIFIDLGGGTTDVIVIAEGSPICTYSLPIGGEIVTTDISQVRGIPSDVAERIKLSSGCCWLPLLNPNDSILIPSVGGRPPETVLRTEICEIIQPRVQEMLEMVRYNVLTKINGRRLNGNIVLVGGGAKMSGIIELTSSVFGMNNVRIGIPAKQSGGLDEYRTCDYATATGLVLASFEQRKNHANTTKKSVSTEKKHNFWESVKTFFKDFF